MIQIPPQNQSAFTGEDFQNPMIRMSPEQIMEHIKKRGDLNDLPFADINAFVTKFIASQPEELTRLLQENQDLQKYFTEICKHLPEPAQK